MCWLLKIDGLQMLHWEDNFRNNMLLGFKHNTKDLHPITNYSI